VYAAVLGAKIIERHITIDHGLWGTDQAASLEVHAMDLLRKRIKDVDVILGTGNKIVTETEKEVRKKLRGDVPIIMNQKEKIPVIILCGGLGTRLREETEFRPKPLVEIGGKPILWHIMKTYSHYGFNNFILCLGYKGSMIKEYFSHYNLLNKDFTITLGQNSEPVVHNDHCEKDWRITFVDTGEDALKGARLKRAEKYIDGDTFMVTYGDGVSNVDISKLLEFHKQHGKLATLTGVRPPSRFGELILEGDRIKKFEEKPQSDNKPINGGFFVFNRKIFDYLEDKDECDLERGALEKVAESGELMMYRHPDFWYCMDTPRDFDYLRNMWRNGNVPWKRWKD
jgi:glucose-1-phosphate cytidylyltransferase